MKSDFSGYATRAGIKCTDGRTIMPNAFEHQDKMRVPLVWQHGHTDPENVLGHAILENRPDGVYAYAFFNRSAKAKHAAELVEHQDITQLSIWANGLIQKAQRVMHGAIREVSLVLAGANPGALIENVTIRHSADDLETLDDEAIIYTDLTLEHGVEFPDEDDDDKDKSKEKVVEDKVVEDKTVDDKEKEKEVAHADDTTDDGESMQDIYDSMDKKQKDVLHFMIGQALEGAADTTDTTAEHSNLNKEGKTNMGTRNAFEKKDDKSGDQHVLTHDAMQELIADGKRTGSLKHAVEEYCLEHGITDIDQLFPDAKNVSDVPEWIKRRTEWVTDLLGAVRKSPFSRIRTLNADITEESARAKGYIKGNFKKEEFFRVARRTTTPTTIYKKQALDRDDMVDITDFDVVVWLKGEMRLMLDEELARAILIGDGRDPSDEDKIDEQCIRPIATDNELYTTTVTVNVSDANSSMNEVMDALLMNRAKLKGSGLPDFYTTEYWIARFLMVRETGTDRRMWRNVDELATEMRVRKIVAVEVMLEHPDIIGVLVNPVDYVLGADKGGQVSMFDDFDIDYNKQKYLIETRCSGALTKIKSAMVIRSTTGTNVLANPTVPTFNAATGALTIVNTTGVVYKHGATVVNAAGSPYTVPEGETWVIDATPATGYYFATSDDDQWSFTADSA